MLFLNQQQKTGNLEDLSTHSAPVPKLLDLVRDRIRVKHDSIRTEASYARWIKRLILFHGKRHPREMVAALLNQFGNGHEN